MNCFWNIETDTFDVHKIILIDKKYKETTYIKGKKDGLTSEWYENGKRKLKTTFKKGIKNGIHTEWNENGEKTIEGEFTLGVLTSKKNWVKNI